MKLLLILVLICATISGCANGSGGPPASNQNVHPPGTNIGASNSGVNQPTQTTTATRSTDSPR